jgi:hypothetical protein
MRQILVYYYHLFAFFACLTLVSSERDTTNNINISGNTNEKDTSDLVADSGTSNTLVQIPQDNKNDPDYYKYDYNRKVEDKYDGPYLDYEEDLEIDCSKFDHLEKLPSFCQEPLPPVATTITSPDSMNLPAPPPANAPTYFPVIDETIEDPPETSTPDRNVIHVPVSMGILRSDLVVGEGQDRVHPRVVLFMRLIAQVASALLDCYAPFDVSSSFHRNHRQVQRQLEEANVELGSVVMEEFLRVWMQNSRGLKRKRWTSSSSSSTSEDNNDVENREANDDEKIEAEDNNDVANRGANGDENKESVARLVVQAPNIMNATNNTVEGWWIVDMQFAAFWPNDDPIVHQGHLDEITNACANVLNITIHARKFWQELQLQDKESEYVAAKDWDRGT